MYDAILSKYSNGKLLNRLNIDRVFHPSVKCSQRLIFWICSCSSAVQP
ncbi:hypothetical protein [Klebsiella phage vB_KpnS-VAC70]|uniref:Uncharacterized protein n=1 Tax=Klebsiella phage vB_KpnS-VAC70 TaxID=2866699 RepID=A0A8K1YYX4_9CAUD|nr:hypothetical protein [Klebsiella phage vB_KpnS-VAC70]